jgi:hypothetical protein
MQKKIFAMAEEDLISVSADVTLAWSPAPVK